MAIRVLYIAGTSVIGGAEINLLRVINYGRTFGIEPVAVLAPQEGPLVERLQGMGVPVGIISYYALRWPNPFRYCQTLWQLYSWVRCSDPDVVHLNHHWFIEYACRVKQISKLPVIADVRGVESDDFMRQHRRWLLGVDLLTVPSQAAGNHLERRQIPRSKIQLIHDGVHPNEFISPSKQYVLREEFGIPPHVPLVGIVGRVVREKGIEEFLRAARTVSEANHEVCFAIVGSDSHEGQDIEAYKALARSLGIADRVIFTGFRSDIVDVLHDLDLFVLASWMDACPNSVLEAMAAGKLVVATDVGGVPEIVVHGQTGFLTRARDPERLAVDILAALHLSPEKRAAMAKAAQARIREEFNIQTQVAHLKALYAHARMTAKR